MASLVGIYDESEATGGNDYYQGSSDDEEYERMTAAEVLEKMEEAWLNEMFAPELLDHKTDIVNCILLQIKEMTENLSQVSKGDFVARIHHMELNRVIYIVDNYLKVRLEKIEGFILSKLSARDLLQRSQATPPLLSPEEQVFARDFAEIVDKHFKNLALQHMPSNMSTVSGKAMTKPNPDKYVFVKALERSDQVLVDPEFAGPDREAVDFVPGSQYILRYQPVSSLIKSGAVKLI